MTGSLPVSAHHASFYDLQSHGVFSVKLLRARMHHASSSRPPGVISLADAVTEANGTVSTGDEPGSDAYAPDGSVVLVRTGALNRDHLNAFSSEDGLVRVRGHAYKEQSLGFGDILIAKDGPVGQVGFVGWSTSGLPHMLSSGIVRIRMPAHQWFYLAVLKYGPFTSDVEALTPEGSTIRHAGLARIMDANVPKPGSAVQQEQRIAAFVRLMVRAEELQGRLARCAADLVASSLAPSSLLPTKGRSSFSRLSASGRLDAKYHLAMGSDLAHVLREAGGVSINQLIDEGKLERRRGQNLQESAIGYSIKHDDPRPGAYRLLEPNFIARDMSIPSYRYISAPKLLQTLPDNCVVLSAEGSIGRVTVFRGEPETRTVSNIHAFVITSQGEETPREHAWLAASLYFLWQRGWLDGISAGGQGGSLAAGYHGDLLIPPGSVVLKERAFALLSAGTPVPTADELTVKSTSELQALVAKTRTMSHSQLGALRRNAELALRAEMPALLPQLY